MGAEKDGQDVGRHCSRVMDSGSDVQAKEDALSAQISRMCGVRWSR